MKLAPYIACVCEGSAEAAIIDVLVDNNLLIFTREDIPKGEYSLSDLSIPGDSEPPFRRHSTAVPF